MVLVIVDRDEEKINDKLFKKILEELLSAVVKALDVPKKCLIVVDKVEMFINVRMTDEDLPKRDLAILIIMPKESPEISKTIKERQERIKKDIEIITTRHFRGKPDITGCIAIMFELESFSVVELFGHHQK